MSAPINHERHRQSCRKLNILFVVPYAPTLIRARPHNFIKSIRKHGHDLTIATLVTNEKERQSLSQWHELGVKVVSVNLSRWRPLFNCLKAVPSKEPLQAAYCWEPKFAQQLAQIAPSYDVVHVEHLRGSRYGLLLKQQYPDLPILWDSVDCISLLFEKAALNSSSLFSRMMTRFDLARTKRFEGWLPQNFERVIATSAKDIEALSNLAGSHGVDNFSIVTNGVDLEYFNPIPEGQRLTDTLIFTGKMSYHANVTMAEFLVHHVLPIIRKQNANVQLLIVGQNPTRKVLELAHEAGVTVTGSVPHLRDYIQRASVSVAPVVYGVGIQNKILEAMACGIPVVTTPEATHSLASPVGTALLVGRNAQELADHVLDLLNSPEKRHHIGAAGRNYVESHHQWDVLGKTLEGLYYDLVT